MKTLLISAGNMNRWGKSIPTPKHLVEIEGEPILYRSARLFAQHGPVEIIARPGRKGYKHPAATTHEARFSGRNTHADRFLSSYHRWDADETMVLVYGDCYYTEEAVALFADLAEKDDWAWVARLGPSKFTGRSHGEGFGFVLPPAHHDLFKTSVEETIRLWDAGKIRGTPPRGWSVWQVMEGDRPHKPRTPLPHWVEVNDWTDDFDRADDYRRWMKRRAAWMSSTP